MVTLYLEPLSLCDINCFMPLYIYSWLGFFVCLCVVCIVLNGHRPKSYNFCFIVIHGYTQTYIANGYAYMLPAVRLWVMCPSASFTCLFSLSPSISWVGKPLALVDTCQVLNEDKVSLSQFLDVMVYKPTLNWYLICFQKYGNITV